jgi:hypothetical protein
MAATWEACEDEWRQFAQRVAVARHRLNCSISSAWFRGHHDCDYQLLPSLLRQRDKLDADRAAAIRNLTAEREKWSAAAKSLGESRRQLADAHRTKNATAILKAQATLEVWTERCKQLKLRNGVLDRRINVLNSVHYGEQDAFIQWTFRDGQPTARNSWEILSEMQHFGVPTRLLDWTEALATGVYFALEKFIPRLHSFWNQPSTNGERSRVGDDPFPCLVPDDLPEPCIWVLNPYELSRRSIKQNMILDLSREHALDYFDAFFRRQDWPYEHPVPTFLPWRNSRISSQRGFFIVFGFDRRSLIEQFPSARPVAVRVTMSRPAATFAVRLLHTFLNIDRFDLFRDLDSLGDSIKRRFIIPK